MILFYFKSLLKQSLNSALHDPSDQRSAEKESHYKLLHVDERLTRQTIFIIGITWTNGSFTPCKNIYTWTFKRVHITEMIYLSTI